MINICFYFFDVLFFAGFFLGAFVVVFTLNFFRSSANFSFFAAVIGPMISICFKRSFSPIAILSNCVFIVSDAFDICFKSLVVLFNSNKSFSLSEEIEALALACFSSATKPSFIDNS
jgi:hypothetical protein